MAYSVKAHEGRIVPSINLFLLLSFLVADGARGYFYAKHSRFTTIRAVPQAVAIIYTY